MDSRMKLAWIAAVTLIFAFLAAVYVTKTFVTTIMLSVFLAYILVPVYNFIQRITGRKRLSSILSILIVFLIFIIFVINIISTLSAEVSNLSLSQEEINRTAASYINQKTDDIFNNFRGFTTKYLPDSMTPYAEGMIENAKESVSAILNAPTSSIAPEVIPHVVNFIKSLATGIASNLMKVIVQFGVAILLTYYFLIDGKSAVNNAIALFPEKEIVRRFLAELNAIYNSLFNVYLISSFITGMIGAVGFMLLGISYPFLWGMTIAIFAFIPLIGTSVVYVPLAIYYLVTQNYVMGGIVFVFGLIFLNVIPENILRPRLAMRGASIHPAITLLAFAAPLFVVGAKGIIVGPAIYGFILAAYRTKIYFLKAESESVGKKLEGNDGKEYGDQAKSSENRIEGRTGDDGDEDASEDKNRSSLPIGTSKRQGRVKSALKRLTSGHL